MSRITRDGKSLVHRDMEQPVGMFFEITGTVQGVGMRAHVQRTALLIGGVGWGRNDEGGSVVGWAEGTNMNLKRFLVALKPGPAGARIDAVESMDGQPKGNMTGFEIRK